MKRSNVVIRQIMPAAPGSFALYLGEDGFGLHRVPLIAWGVWDRTEEVGQQKPRTETTLGEAGPLVYACGVLCPAVDYADNFEGVRVGGCRLTGDGEGRFDNPEAGIERAATGERATEEQS